jgi:uncharacterized protein (DUF362 family)
MGAREPGIDRRQFVAALTAASTAGAASWPGSAVAIGRCRSYDEDQAAVMGGLFEKLGGLGGLVKGKTVTVKLNLTGSPGLRLGGRPLGVTHYTHPKHVAALVHLLSRAGARRVRLVESAWATASPLEEFMLDAGWNVRALKSVSPVVEFENTNAKGRTGRYARFKTQGGGLVFPSYTLNAAYEETDVFVSLAKLKQHETCGVTLGMKNIFGITPASIYGDDAGTGEPNEHPEKGRVDVCHMGKRQPAQAAEAERDLKSTREPETRMPRITADLAVARPIHLVVIDGVETVAGGEGPWIKGLRAVQPGVMIAGFNPVAADAVGTAVMGFNPRAPRGQGAFARCENTLLLAERLGLGSANLAEIEVRGLPLEEAVFSFAR